MNIIEKLKKNKMAFGLLELEEQECFREVGKKNCLVYDIKKTWDDKAPCQFTFWPHETCRIKPDYQPEPDYVDLEIKKNGKWLGAWAGLGSISELFANEFAHLHCLPSLPNFEGFCVDDMPPRLCLEAVARKISQGCKVYARFRKAGD